MSNMENDGRKTKDRGVIVIDLMGEEDESPNNQEKEFKEEKILVEYPKHQPELILQIVPITNLKKEKILCPIPITIQKKKNISH